MADMKPLELNCFEMRSDTMSVETDQARGEPVVYMRMRNSGESCSTSLNTESARALFNWLGVWLLTPR